MAKRIATRKCPVCKIEVKAGRLENHIRKAHPDQSGEERAVAGRRTRRTGLNAGHWAVIGVVATVLVAAVAVYVVSNRHTPEVPNIIYNKPVASGPQTTTYVRIETSQGPIVVGLYGNETPITVKNFLKLVNAHYYDNTVFHRVIKDFVIQGGGYNDVAGQLVPKDPGVSPIPLEINLTLKNTRGTMAMARTSDSNSATSQFYINVVDNPSLDAGYNGGDGYAVFGTVLDNNSMRVVDTINTVITGTASGMQDVPVEPVRVTAIMNAADAPK